MNRHQRRANSSIISKPGASRPSAHCHEMIAQTAKEMAHEVYDELMKKNDWYDNWKSQNEGATAKELEARFVDATWGKFISEARGALAHMLTTPIDEDIKAKIMEALELDNTLIRGRANGSSLLLPH